MQVYADHAATTKITPQAKAAMLQCMDVYYGNPSSLHTPGQHAKVALETARDTIATHLGASSREIYFTSGGTEADNQAILTAAAIGAMKNKRHIISTKFEHHAVLHTLDKLKKQGYEITLLDVHSDGIVRPEDLRKAIRPDTALVTIMYVNNEVGTVQPISELGAICRKAGVLFHTDAVQAVGHIPVSVVNDHIDMLSLSAHKFGGPRCVGVLYAKKGIALHNLIEGGAQERGKRAGTENLPAIMGMAAALDEAIASMAENARRVSQLRDRLIIALSKIPHSAINGNQEHHCPGILNMCFEGIEGESLLLLLDAQGISASSGSACTSGSLEPSHVLLSMGVPIEVAHGSLRLSLGPENTEEEIDHIIACVSPIVQRLRDMSPVWEALERGEMMHAI